MKRVCVVGGAWGAVLVIAGACLAADNNQAARNAAAAQAARAQAAAGVRSAPRYVSPSQYAASQPNQAARNAAAAQAARAQAAAGQSVQSAADQAAAAQNAAGSAYPYPYGYGYPGYGYYRYGNPYSPYGTTPYAIGYDPYSGQSYLLPNPGGYSPYSPYGYRSPYYGNPYLGLGYPGAVFVNPGQLYGIGPIQQLMGVAPWFQQQNVAPFAAGNIIGQGGAAANANPGFGNANAVAGNNNPGPQVAAANPPAPKPAAGNKAMDLAWKFIAFGDAQFADLKYNDALDRYRRAARESPHLGDAWFREGFALAAMGKYDLAAKALRRGLDEKPDWADVNFRLDEVYGDNGADKKACVARVVRAAETEPTSGDLALVAGIHLYCDGRIDQAVPFFRRAAQIEGNDADVKAFLAKAQQ